MTLNTLGAIVLALHLAMKFPNQSGDIVIVKANQVEARKCYAKSLLIKPYKLCPAKHANAVDVNHVENTTLSWDDLDPSRDVEDGRPTPTEELCCF